MARPRDPAADTAILDAAIALIRDVGYDAVTMGGVAERAGVGKATLYRRWKTKELLVAEALHGIASRIPEADTGSTAGDLGAVMRATVAMYRDPATRELLSGLIAAMARSARIGAALRRGFIAKRRDAMRNALKKGVRRGDLRRGTDIELAVDLLSGPLLHRALISGARIDERLARALVHVVLRAFGT